MCEMSECTSHWSAVVNMVLNLRLRKTGELLIS